MPKMTKRTLSLVEPELEFAGHKDFEPSLIRLAQRGGKYHKAAERIQAVLGKVSIRNGENPLHGLKMTKHGENRVDKCVKYDFGGGAIRLITIQDSGIVLFCFTGTHAECDEWLDRNKGATLIRDGKGQIRLNPLGVVRDGAAPKVPLTPPAGKLYELIKPVDYFDRLVDPLPRTVARRLEDMEAGSSGDEIISIAESIEDTALSETVLDVFFLLKQDQPDKAMERIRLFFGESQTISELTREEIAALAESDQIRKISPDAPYYPQVLEHFARHGMYMDWMLYLHPDQQEIVDRSFNGSAKLIGVSGSGKTCVIVQRAIRLARDNPDERVLVLTLNRQLARLIEDMTRAATTEEVAERIRVLPLFKLCQELLHRFEPENDRLYDDITWKSHEHIDEIWREFYRCELNNHDAEVLLPPHDSLIARGIDAEQYIREEMDWIRSAFPPRKRHQYLEAERTGRSFPLDKRYRELLLQALEAWERKMRHVGVTDYLGISTVLTRYMDRIEPEYRFILVDESQDFGTIELQLIRRLAAPATDDLFFCGDAAQTVQTKHGNFRQAGISIPGARSLALKKNYRNSREILSVAYEVLVNNLAEEMLDSPDFDILDPEHANFSGAAPLLLGANTLEEEIGYARAYVEEFLDGSSGKKCCIALCGYSLYQVQEFGKHIGMKVLDGTITINEDDIYLSDLEHTKGFEFDLVLILNCNAGVIPDLRKPHSEQFRDLSRFYVAMTRAKYQLVISWSDRPSDYLKGLDDRILEASWAEYITDSDIQLAGIPPSLTEIRRAHEQIDKKLSVLDLSGADFLYTRHAIGLEPNLIRKLRSLIAGGKRRSIGGRTIPVGWNTLREAARDIDIYPASRKEFGDDTLQAFKALISRLERPADSMQTNL